MPLTVVRQESAARFQEAQVFLSEVKSLENDFNQPSTVNVKKGLFLILLYGSVEYSVTRAFIEYVAVINRTGVQFAHLDMSLYALALDPQFAALSQVGRDFKWQKRLQIFEKQGSSDPTVLHGGAFIAQMDNIWAKTFAKVFDVLGIPEAPWYHVRVKQYIDELANARNAIAHGRESASTLGQRYTTTSLQNLHEEMVRQAQHLFSLLETHVSCKSFVHSVYRSYYS